MSNYLQECFRLHGEVSKICYGRIQDLDRTSEVWAEKARTHRLTYRDLADICNSDLGDVYEFGVGPAPLATGSDVEELRWDFRDLPKREDEAIGSLLRVLRQIEPVSVVMRIVAPESYGIMSPPVERVLGIGPRRPEERYRGYLKDLRSLQRHFKFKRTSDVDMAIWALEVGVLEGKLKGSLSEEEYNSLCAGYKKDTKLREIRVGNLTRELFDDLSRPELAGALFATNIELAGQIAGIEFERSVRKRLGVDPGDRDSLRSMVGRLRPVSAVDEAHLKSAVDTRNQAVHGDIPEEGDRRHREFKGDVEALIRHMDLNHLNLR